MFLSIPLLFAITTYATIGAAVSLPACQSIAPPQQTINIQTTNVTLNNSPFGIVYARKDIAFVGAGANVALLNTSTFPPVLINTLPTPFGTERFAVAGLAISRDKRILYLSSGPGAIVIDVEKAIAGGAGSIVDYLNGTVGTSSIETTLSLHSEYAFVSQEYGSTATGLNGAIEVFRMHHTRNGSVSNIYVGYIELDLSVVGTALSPDGKRLYATSENVLDSISSTGTYNVSATGTLSVLDVEILKTNPSEALLASVDAGCGPVRVAVSHDGKLVWVTARESNMLLAFNAAKLETNSSDALVASVQVGTSPVGVVLVNGGQHIITADSNRFRYKNTTTGLTVVNVEAALKGEQGFPRIPTGLFPREFALSPDGKTLLVSDYASGMVQAVNVSQLTLN
jgi:DNA-binding beta-propeller fold protein YncE